MRSHVLVDLSVPEDHAGVLKTTVAHQASGIAAKQLASTDADEQSGQYPGDAMAALAQAAATSASTHLNA